MATPYEAVESALRPKKSKRPPYKFEVEYLDVYNGESSISGYYGHAQTPFEAWDRILTYLRGSVDGYVLHTIIERVDEREETHGGTTGPDKPICSDTNCKWCHPG